MCFPIKFEGSAPLSHISVCFAAHQTGQSSPSIVGSWLYDAKSFEMTVVVSWRYINRTEVTPNSWLYWLHRPVTSVFPPVHFMFLFFVFLVCFRVFFTTNEFVIYWPSPVISLFCHGFWARMWHNKDGGEKKRKKKMEGEWQLNAFLSIHPLCSHHSLPFL